MKKIRLLLSFLPCLLVAVQSKAETKTFNVTSGAWGTAGNWLPSGVPTITDTVLIPVGKTVTGLSGGAVNNCAALGVAGTLIFSGGNPRYLTVNGDVLITGTITMSGSNGYYFNFKGSNFVVMNTATWTLGTSTSNESGIRFSDTDTATIISAIPIGSIIVNSGMLKLGSDITCATAKSSAVTVDAGATLDANNFKLTCSNGAKTLNVNGKLVITGATFAESVTGFETRTIGADGIIEMGGSVATQTLDVKLNYQNLIIKKAAGEVKVEGGNITLGKTLTLTSGNLVLEGFDIIMSGVQGGSESSHVVTTGAGSLKVNNVGASVVLFPVGPSTSLYSPLSISNSGTADNFKVRVSSSFTNAVNLPNKVVNAEWNISEDVAGGSNATLGFKWQQSQEGSELNKTSNFVAGHYVGSAWTETAITPPGAGNFEASISSVTSFSPFGVGNTTGFLNDALPVKILSFNALPGSQGNLLQWKVAAEINMNSYEVERSANGRSFSSLGRIGANHGTAYSFNDLQPEKSVNYYRLKLINADGKYSYSQVIAINSKSSRGLKLLGNLAHGNLFVLFSPAGTNASLSITNTLGARLLVQKLSPGSQQTTLNVGMLPAGTYQLSYTSNGKVETERFVKQ